LDVSTVLLVTSLVYYLQACSWNEDIFDTFDQLSLECWPTLGWCLPGASENATKAQDADFLYWFTQNFGRIIVCLSIPTYQLRMWILYSSLPKILDGLFCVSMGEVSVLSLVTYTQKIST
jgi:hypothetical protein